MVFYCGWKKKNPEEKNHVLWHMQTTWSSKFRIHKERIIKTQLWEFPGVPVAETPCFQCRGPRSDLWSGNKITYAETKRSKSLRASSKTRCVCVRAKLLQSCPTLYNLIDYSPVGSSVHGVWSGLPCPPPGDLPSPQIELASLSSPTLTDGFFTPRATWEA